MELKRSAVRFRLAPPFPKTARDAANLATRTWGPTARTPSRYKGPSTDRLRERPAGFFRAITFCPSCHLAMHCLGSWQSGSRCPQAESSLSPASEGILAPLT